MLEFLHLAVGEADMGAAARSESDRALRSGATLVTHLRPRSPRISVAPSTVGRDDLAVLAAADQPAIGGVGDGGQQAVMRLAPILWPWSSR